MKKTFLIITVLMLIVGCSAKKKPPKSSINQTTDKHTQEQPLTKQPSGKDLIGYDWVYPDMNNLMAAWKFSSDGTFNVSQKAFGGSTRRGQWKDLGNGQVELIYDDGGFVRSGDGGSANVDARTTITLSSKSKFQLGSTVYRRY
jgi:hypothetical protein|tara:strand:+ start:71 stop:502 length:432 start_codon:yes stop_codon:yes gene_type:complete